MPFGEEIASGTGGRNSAQGYGGQDSIRQKFTGYERDAETDLDFAQARMYNKNHGRFTSVDPLMASARISNPKTWNRYSYVMNNPLRFIDPDGMDVQVLDEKARNNLLKTLPEEIRKQVEKQIGKNGVLKKGALDKIKSKDQNFKDLKEMVNNKNLTEVMTATNSTGSNSANFFQRTASENKEYDIQNYMKNNNVSREDAEKFFKELGITWEDSAYYGYTLSPSESPSGNLRIVVTDQTGEAANVSEETAVVTTGHELYGHGVLFRQGKPYGHDKVPDSFFDAIEKRTQTNYRNGQQKVNTPQNMKPKP
jgi:RHS repeat-associated protein